MAKKYTEEELKDLANARLSKFKEECAAAGIASFSMAENTKLKSAFMKSLLGSYKENISKASFMELASDLYGYGLEKIEDYLSKEQMESAASEGFGEAANNENGKEEKAKAPTVPSDEKKEGDKEGAEKDASAAAEAEPKRPGRKKKVDAELVPARKSSNLDVLFNPAAARSGERAEITRLKKQLTQLQYEKDCAHRQMTLYRRDLSVLDAITEYGKKKSTNLTVDGTVLDSRINVLHAALSLLVKELDAMGADECFEYVKKAISLQQDEIDYRDKRIDEIKARLKEYGLQ